MSLAGSVWETEVRLNDGWTWLVGLQSNKEGSQLSDMVLCLHAWPACSTHWSHLFLRHRFLYSSSLEFGCTVRNQISDQSSQTMKVIIFVVSEIWRKHLWRCMAGKFNLSCRNNVMTGLDGTGTLLWQVMWKRQIRSAREILGSLLKTYGQCLDVDFLLTIMA